MGRFADFKLRPKEEWIPIPVTSIIDKDLFYRAQKQLVINAQFSMRNKKHDYFLSGLIYCECGSRMCGEGSDRGHFYYNCFKANTPSLRARR